MVFQDFDQISQLRQAERKRKTRKRIIIGVVLTILVIGGIGAGIAYYFIHRNGSQQSGGQQNEKQQAAKSQTQVSHSEKMIKQVCGSTDYKTKCESTLKDAAQKNPKSTQPKDFLKASIEAVSKEVTKAFNNTEKFQFNSPEEKAAFNNCKVLIDDAIEELGKTISHVQGTDIQKLSSKTPELNSWLSAVMSYPETCVDGFPEGQLKSDMKKSFQNAKELTSNSLALVSAFSNFLSKFQTPKSSRRLLANDGLPTWMSHDDRRILKATDGMPTPNVIVAKDGSGNFSAINEALSAIPADYQGRYVIYIKEGVYEEIVTVTKKMVNVLMYGDGSQKSVITGNRNNVDGYRTFETATFVALGEGFMAKSLGFKNTAGPEKHQAVAARVQADRAIFQNCRFEGFQDTLYAQTHRQFYRSCLIRGTVDFIFGDAAAIFQNCDLLVRKPMDNQQNIVTAQGRMDKREETGIILQNCHVLPDPELEPVKSQFKTYLGRPWKEFSRTVVMESTIEDLISPDGWMPWQGDFGLKTLYYAEYNNKGPGAGTNARVNWPGYKVINKDEAAKFTVGSFLPGDWINATVVPVRLGLSS